MNKKYLLILTAVSMLAFGACKKSKNEPTPTPTKEEPKPEDETPPTTTNRTELSIDSIYLYAKQLYYWNDNLPTYKAFNPRQFNVGSVALDKYENELLGIANYSANKYDIYQNSTKYSNITDITTKNPSATGVVINDNKSLSVDLLGNGNDVGIRLVSYLLDNTRTRYLPFVTAVYQNSPAESAGVKRGWYISKANGQAYGANYTNEIANLNAALNGISVTLELTNLLTSAKTTVTLAKASYKSSPVYKTKVITAGAKKIGYFAFARFSKLTVSGRTPSDVNLDAAFNEFSSQGVTDLIVDLRYNGGGYVETAEYLTNLIAPSSNNGKVMFTEHYNATMQNNKATILKNQPLLDANGKVQRQNGNIVTYFDYMTNPYSVANNTATFSKKGNLNSVQNVIFLVTGNTASSSELVINSLKPHMSVKVIGATTYGKPIGFFPIVIENRYEVYFSLFETRNSLGQGGYYAGIKPEVGYDEDADASGEFWDDIRYDFGDVKEAYLAGALKILAPGVTFTNSARVASTMSVNGESFNLKNFEKMKPLKNDSFVGMIENRTKLKN
ncbi:S41 family peptidase [Pedobacter xixiisoli]|uniref:C-terminal processing protease CtpA/Prc, contains a PDZ domain n=1 Tax=Pedobacter xixiisoli TaxID=1476464 RepID=A0A285ZPV9_9SPHI|nr:S41 family peptidase [Pedobacter xixiisoli]SOD11670.1 C-terminal processing protease CtpA/Prc, contains a PDZ domain [Pedobacter xixiisoli]